MKGPEQLGQEKKFPHASGSLTTLRVAPAREPPPLVDGEVWAPAAGSIGLDCAGGVINLRSEWLRSSQRGQSWGWPRSQLLLERRSPVDSFCFPAPHHIDIVLRLSEGRANSGQVKKLEVSSLNPSHLLPKPVSPVFVQEVAEFSRP